MMLYIKDGAKLKKLPFSSGMALSSDIVWIDMLDPIPEEEACAEKFLGLDIPTREEMHELELSRRFYQKNGAVYMSASLTAKTNDGEPAIHAVTFILAGQRLITVRYADLPPFRQLAAELEKMPAAGLSGAVLFVDLAEDAVEYAADILEQIGRDVDEMTRAIFYAQANGNATPDYRAILKHIGHTGDLVSKIRESLMTLNRMAGYALQAPAAAIEGEPRLRLETRARDIPALTDHANFLAGKLSFLLDATLGMITIDQNGVIKILSVAAVVFLPPTLIASIYGMNFHFMPELASPLGYPLALAAMAVSAIVPYLYFKRRKWL